MSNQIVRFSRLLRIFKLNNRPAYIIELEDNDQKMTYISYSKNSLLPRYFESYEKTKLKDEFKELSDHCLMSQCTDASGMFEESPITHFEADCSNVVIGKAMFYNSSLFFINTEFPLLNDGDWMFCQSKIKEININFPQLISADSMFSSSSVEKITSQFPLLEKASFIFQNTLLKDIDINFPRLEEGRFMFSRSPLEKITSKFPRIKDKYGMFESTPFELRQNNPQYFI